MQKKIKELRKDLSQLEASKDKDISNFRHWERLERKYSIRVKRLNVVTEELKQKITAIAAKVRRYHERVDSYRQKQVDIITGSLKKILGRMPNWKSPVPDLSRGFM